MAMLQEKLAKINAEGFDYKIASVMGRYYAMNREKFWDITEKAFESGVTDILVKPVNPHIALNRVKNITSWFNACKLEEQNRMYRSLLRESEIDEKTGVYNKQAFCRHASELIASEPDKKFIILRWDIDRFKIFNIIFNYF